MVQRYFQIFGLYARRTVVCVTEPTTEKFPFMLGKKTSFMDETVVYCKPISPGSHYRAFESVCRSGGNNAPDRPNPTLIKDLIEMMESWFV